MKKVKLDVEGMHCVSCSKILSGELEKIGAKNISVNSVSGKAFVEVNDDISIKHLEKAVKDAGFKLVDAVFENSTSSFHKNKTEPYFQYQ